LKTRPKIVPRNLSNISAENCGHWLCRCRTKQIIDAIHGDGLDSSHTMLTAFGGMYPASPNDRRITWPLGLTVSSVTLPCFKDSRNQASGGNCSALKAHNKQPHKGVTFHLLGEKPWLNRFSPKFAQ